MELRLMTSNVWGDYFGNPVKGRDKNLAGIYLRYLPDVLGLQEVTESWRDSELYPALRNTYSVVSAETCGKNNHTPLLYNREKFELLDSGWYLYHEKLDASKGYTMGVFREKNGGKRFAVFCTHFWWKPDLSDAVIRYYNAKDMVQKMKQIGETYSCPVFFMGDLNCFRDSDAWTYLREQGWETSYRLTADCSPESSWHDNPIRGEDGEFHGKIPESPNEKSIDHIGVETGIRVLRQRIVLDQEALDATDHSPVYADVSIV